MASLLQFGLVNALLVVALAAIVALVDWRVRRPALIHALWLLVLAKLITPPLVGISIEVPVAARDERPESTRPANAVTAHERDGPCVACTDARDDVSAEKAARATRPVAGVPFVPGFVTRGAGWLAGAVMRIGEAVDRRSPWLPWFLYGAWGTGAIVWFLRQAYSVHRFQARLAQAAPAPSAIQQQALRLAADMGLARCPEVVVVSDVISPMLWGLGLRTRLVFPVGLLERLDRQSCSTLLAHELAHFGRGDHWVRALELIVTGLYWWHPAVWWARRRIEAAEEECCDAWVVAQFSATPRVYAEALLATIDFLSETPRSLPAAATGLGQVPFLRQRLIQIMRGVAPRSLSYPARLAVLALAVALLPVHPVFSPAGPAAKAAVAELPDAPNPSRADVLLVASPASPPPALRPVIHRTDERDVEVIRKTRLVTSPPVEPQPDWAVATSPDGRFSITQQIRGSVSLFDEATRRTRSLSDHRILAVAFSADGRQFVTGGEEDGTVRLWNSATAQVTATLTGHTGAVRTVAFAPDAPLVISGSQNGELIVWNCATQRPVVSDRLRQAPVNSVAFSRDGGRVAVAAGSWQSLAAGRVSLRDIASLEERWVFESNSLVGAVAFHEDGKSLVAGEWNGRVTIWDLATQRATATGLIPKDLIHAASFSVDTQTLSHLDRESLIPSRSPPAPSRFNEVFTRELGDAQPLDIDKTGAPVPVHGSRR